MVPSSMVGDRLGIFTCTALASLDTCRDLLQVTARVRPGREASTAWRTPNICKYININPYTTVTVRG